MDFIDKNKDNDAYIIFDYETLEYLDNNGKIIGYKKKIQVILEMLI